MYVATYYIQNGGMESTNEVEVRHARELWPCVFGTAYYVVEIRKQSGNPRGYITKDISEFRGLAVDPARFALEIDAILAEQLGLRIKKGKPTECIVPTARDQAVCFVSGNPRLQH